MTPGYNEEDIAGYLEGLCGIDPTQLEFTFPADNEPPFDKSEPDNPPEFDIP